MPLPLTNPVEGQDLHPQVPSEVESLTRNSGEVQHRGPGALVFPDATHIRTHAFVPDDVLLGLSRFRGHMDREGEVYAEGGHSHNLYVRNGGQGALLSGSLRNWADQEGLVSFPDPFGPEEVGRVMNALDRYLHLPPGTVQGGRLTKLEIAADLVLPRPVGEYVATLEDVPRAIPHRVGYTTAFYKTQETELRVYDKAAELVASGEDVPEEWLGAHVARVEFALRSGGVPRALGHWKDQEGLVRAGLLANPEFRDELAAFWAERARSLRFRRVARPDQPATRPADRVKWLAVRGMEAEGGLRAAIQSVDSDIAAGHLEPTAAKAHRRALRDLALHPAYSAASDLESEFAAAVDLITEQPPAP